MKVRRVTVSMTSTGPYSSSKLIEEKKEGKEDYEEYESRVWKQRCHFTKAGEWFIPAMAFKLALQSASKYESIKLTGNEKFGKVITSAVMPDMAGDPQGIGLGITRDNVQGEWFFVPGQPKPGKQGVGTRVKKCFPVCPQWSGNLSFFVLDGRLTQPIFERIFFNAGLFVGVGRWRAENGGLYGRFQVNKMKWEDLDMGQAG